MFGVLYVVVSLVVGLFLFEPLFAVLSFIGVPVPNKWAVAHGAVIIVWPAVAALCFPFVAGAGQLLRRRLRKF